MYTCMHWVLTSVDILCCCRGSLSIFYYFTMSDETRVMSRECFVFVRKEGGLECWQRCVRIFSGARDVIIRAVGCFIPGLDSTAS